MKINIPIDKSRRYMTKYEVFNATLLMKKKNFTCPFLSENDYSLSLTRVFIIKVNLRANTDISSCAHVNKKIEKIYVN